MVATMLFSTILIGFIIAVRSSSSSSSSSFSQKTHPTTTHLLQNAVVVVDANGFEEKKNVLLRPIVRALKGSLPWTGHGISKNGENEVLETPGIFDRLPPRGGAHSNSADASVAVVTVPVQTTPPAENDGKNIDEYNYDENTYVWKGNSRSMYEHSVELIPRLFRDKSRRKILKGLTDRYKNKSGNTKNTNMGVADPVVVDEEAMYQVIRETTPSFVLSKSLSVLDEYSSR